MAKPKVFYSFHFGNDVMRVQQIRNMGVIEGNAPVTPNEWEEVKRKGTASVENWIHENMNYKDCVVVLIGSETAKRPWVLYEIEKAWKEGRKLVGIYIHNIKCPNNGTCAPGENPFSKITTNRGQKLSELIPCYNPSSSDAYNDIARNIDMWINSAAKRAA